MNTDNVNKTKFTATLVTEDDKNTIVALRSETNLSEKELMTLVIATAIAHKDTILAQAREIVETYEKDKLERKAAAYEALKLKLQEQRAAVKAAKAAVDAKKKAPTKKALKTEAAEVAV